LFITGQQLTLTAGTRDEVAVFRRHEFTVEDNDFARSALEVGFSIPMERDVWWRL
jgi:thymidine phosphorylase